MPKLQNFQPRKFAGGVTILLTNFHDYHSSLADYQGSGLGLHRFALLHRALPRRAAGSLATNHI